MSHRDTSTSLLHLAHANTSTAEREAMLQHAQTMSVLEEKRREHQEQQKQNRYAELRSAGANTPELVKQRSQAKSLYLRDALRAAGRRSVSLQAQAVLAMLIAESWWNDNFNSWALRMSRQQIANRGSCSVHSVTRHLQELAGAQLIEVRPGQARTVNRYVLCAFESLMSEQSDQCSAGADSRAAPALSLSVHRR